MDYNEVLRYQESLIKRYKYKPIPPLFRPEVLEYYKNHLPKRFCLDGDDKPLFSSEGLKICNCYNRIVIGDYGAFVEILPEDIIDENIKIKEGQEYRDWNERYSKHTKYSWLTTKDNSDIKIYFQKKKVDYADYVPGRYYISPYECFFGKGLDKDGICTVSREKITGWLNKQGVYSDELLDYYDKLSQVYGNVLDYSIKHNLFPGEFEYWVKLNEICNVEGGLDFEQFSAVKYNLDLIDCSFDELKGAFCSFAEEVKIAIQMGVEKLAFPCEVEGLKPEEIRMLLKLSVDDLLTVSHFSKVIAGCKAESIINDKSSVQDVDELIDAAEQRVQDFESHLEKDELIL